MQKKEHERTSVAKEKRKKAFLFFVASLAPMNCSRALPILPEIELPLASCYAERFRYRFR